MRSYRQREEAPGRKKRELTPYFRAIRRSGWPFFLPVKQNAANTYLQKSGLLGTAFGLLAGMAVILVITRNLQYMIRKAPGAGGIYTLTYRLMVNEKPTYVQLKAARVDEKDGPRIIVGINNIDLQIRQEEEYRQRLAMAQTQASVDALTGIKNKHAYQAAESKLDRQIAEGTAPAFAVSILDINDLKRINDTEGHQAGDQLIRDACRIVCTTFRHSPVFRVGATSSRSSPRGGDLEQINALVGLIADRNEQALRTGGIVIACGTARYEEGKDTAVASVFERADRNMYNNKSSLKAVESRG